MKKNLDTELKPLMKINSKWIIDLKVKCKTVKLLEDKIGEHLGDSKFGDEFSDTILKV